MTVREDRFGNVVQASRPYKSQSLAIGAASVLSAAFAQSKDRPVINRDGGAQATQDVTGNNTRHVRVVCTTAAWVAFGTAPVAVAKGTSSMFMPAGLPEYFWVRVGEQIAVIQDAAAGFCYITELTN